MPLLARMASSRSLVMLGTIVDMVFDWVVSCSVKKVEGGVNSNCLGMGLGGGLDRDRRWYPSSNRKTISGKVHWKD